MKQSLLVTLANKNYVAQAKQLFSGAYLNAGWQGDYMLLSYDIPDEQLKWFSEKGIMVKKCEGLFGKKEAKSLYSNSSKFRPLEFVSVAFNKAYLFTPEFKKWKNILYLDSDIIVRASLEHLANVKGFWAVKDMANKIKYQFLNKKDPLLDELKVRYDLSKKSFNSGVMAFSTDIIKENTFCELKNLFKKYNAVKKTVDQSILNLFFYNKWKPLDISYNTFKPFITTNSGGDSRAVLHFAGPKSIKPWETESPYYQEWKNNLEKAEYVNFRKNSPLGVKITRREMWLNSVRFELELLTKNNKIDRFIGMAGIFLKKISPRAYYFIKKFVR